MVGREIDNYLRSIVFKLAYIHSLSAWQTLQSYGQVKSGPSSEQMF